jgi:hypothetical protein
LGWLFDVDQTDVMLTLCTNFSKAIEVVDEEQKPEHHCRQVVNLKRGGKRSDVMWCCHWSHIFDNDYN